MTTTTKRYDVEADTKARHVYMLPDGMYCSAACLETTTGRDSADMLARGEARRVPMIFRHANAFVEVNIARACCDNCGNNLADLKA